MKRLFIIIIGFLFIGIIVFEAYLRITSFSFNSPLFEEDIPFINRKNVQAEKLYQFDFYLFWKYRLSVDKQTNNRGFRDREFLEVKKSQFRIIALGDSCTAGHQLPPEKTYSKYLESFLNDGYKIKNYEVINAGVPGYTSFQGLRYFRIITNKYHPDLLIVFYGTSDRSRARYADKELSYTRLIKLSFFRFLGAHVRTAQFIMKRLVNVDSIQWKTRVIPEDYIKNLVKIAHEASKNNIKVIFIKPCLRIELETSKEDNSYIPPQPYINLYKVFSGYAGGGSERVFFDFKHFTELGQKLLAEEIYRELVNSQVIKLDKK
ncbi:MAG: SGNH/GDSL hydrolase family protein [Candidatus Omnitrophota bacterium]